jgi:hypothetical protein
MEQHRKRHPPSPPAIQSSQQEAAWPTPPEQIWGLLSPQQQRGVFQILVWLCQELLQSHLNSEQEVSNEPG